MARSWLSAWLVDPSLAWVEGAFELDVPAGA